MSIRRLAIEVLRKPALLVVAALIALLALYWIKFGYNAYLTLLFPGQIDYAEGVIWQQAKLIPGPRMYADFTQFPYIGFQYPPVYQLVVHGIAALGAPWLITGRLITMVSAVALAVLTAAIVKESSRTAEQSSSYHAALLGAVIAGMIWVALQPFQFWSYTMRMDIPAVTLEFLGMYLGLLSLRRPALIYASALIFVLALFTKQNTVAGLVATLTVLLLHTPKRALRAAALASALGVAAFALLTLVTDGGFFRQIVLYEVNRFNLRHAYDQIVQNNVIQFGAGYILVAFLAATVIAKKYLRRPLREMPPGYLLAVLYFLLTTASLVEMGKTGASHNYLISWAGSWALLIGFSVTAIVAMPRSRYRMIYAPALMLVLTAQALNAAKFGRERVVDPEFRREYAELLQMTKQSARPVLSDDTVLLMQAGKENPWEPFIITELSADGMFDERKIIKLIENHTLAFAVVTGKRGESTFDERYSAAVASALEKAYPVERIMPAMRVRVLEPAAND